VHARFRCVDAAVRSGALRRALGVDPSVSSRELSQSASHQYIRRATSLLAAAKRSRKLVLGSEAVRTALAARTVQLLLVARDAEGSREELVGSATRLGLRCLVWSDKEELGRLFGRALLSIVGVLDAGIASELRHVVQCATELAEDA
jgi:ribosomal protein L7Ae-like RNA K-turn-binding protein